MPLLTVPRRLPSRAELRGHAARLIRQARESAAAAHGGWRQKRDRAALRLDPGMARALLAEVEEPAIPGLAPVKTTVFEQQKCRHCLGIHSRHCPAVREIEFHPDGRVARVAYFDRWDDSAVLWREDIETAAAWRDHPDA